MKQLHFPLFALLLVLGLASCGPSGGSLESGGKLLGNQAPNFTLPNLAGEKVELSSFTNQKPTLLVFWATWCPTCKEEIPTLNEWAQKYSGMQIVGIDVQESKEQLQKFLKKQPIQYPILLDEEADIAGQYGLVGIPASVLIAKGGRVIYFGFSLPENVERLIQNP